MTLVRRGDRGDDVAAIQEALRTLGFSLRGDEAGQYGDATAGAVRAFQRARGIGVDGIVGPVTRRELADAAWVLGMRDLGLQTPMLRGDDVRQLQDRLTTLGFDSGKTDGIFGEQTLAALRSFQREYGLDEDGVCGVVTVRALRGLKIMSGDTPIGLVRERERMVPRAAGLIGMRVYLDPGPAGEDAHPGEPDSTAWELCAALGAWLRDAGADVELSRPAAALPEDSLRARLANTLAVELIVSVRVRDDLPPASAWVRSFGHARYRSIRGERAATLVAEALLETSAAKAVEHELATVPILRETRATAVVVDLTPDCVMGEVPAALATAIARCATLGAYGTHA